MIDLIRTVLNRYYFVIITPMIFSACVEEGTMSGTLRPTHGNLNYGGLYRANENSGPQSLDPVQINDVSSSHIAENIYDNLMTYDTALNLTPELADSFSISPNGLTYTYHIRTDVWFHDNACFPGGRGRRMTARDIEYSFVRICDFRSETKAYDYFRGKVVGADDYYEATRTAHRNGAPMQERRIRGLQATDDSTFVIELSKPFGPFASYVALSGMSIHPREAVEYYGNRFYQNPVGTGPFRFVEWKQERHILLERNPRYWQADEHGNRLPYLDGIRFSFIPDDKMQLLEFAAGNLDESYRIANEFFPDIVDIETKQPIGRYAKFQLLHLPSMGVQFYGMLCTHPIFRDKRIRKAFAYAVDRERIVRYVLRGQASAPAHGGLIPPSIPGYASGSVVGYSYNPDTAAYWLKQAGYPGGKGFPPIELQLNAGGGRNVQIAEAVQGMLQDVLGITIRLKQVEWAQHLERVDAGQAEFFRLGWIADYPDPETFLNLWYGKLVPDSGGMSSINHTRYQSDRFDKLFEDAIATTDQAERYSKYLRAEQSAMDDCPMLLIFYDEDYRFLQRWVRGYRNNAMDRRKYKWVWFQSDHNAG